MKIKILTVGRLIRSNQAGFTYLMAMMTVVIMGLMSGVATSITSRTVQSSHEAELLFRGQAYQKAIKSYFETSPRQVKVYPRSLDDLLQDPRFPGVRRHIRSLYPDPMGSGKWALIRAPDGGISGVISESNKQPLKTGNFPVGLESFNGKSSYSEWIFQYVSLSPQSPTRSSAAN